jgi:hypothetical protein
MRLPVLLLAACPLASQTLVVDRPATAAARPQRVERPDGKILSDFFRIGAAGEVWMIDKIRVWAIPATGPACGAELGDSIEKITLLGALDNPPVPGQPVCDCHALVPLAEIPLAKGSSVSGNPNVTLTRRDGLWQIDVRQVRWSVPAAADVLFTVRATARTKGACRAAAQWSLAATPAVADYRLHLLDEKTVPIGPADAAPQPRTIDVQVWATRTSK